LRRGDKIGINQTKREPKMREEHVIILACPQCTGALVVSKTETCRESTIETGLLQCLSCNKTYPIIRSVPRFVPLENYASSFGFEWNKHARTQYDSYTGTGISEKRFFEETKWPRNLTGENILKVGRGSGRFTEVAAATGAMVVSLDYSYAVDANYRSNGQRDNVLISWLPGIGSGPSPRKCYLRFSTDIASAM
jgi:uncharacterized protein YbaR (Trm112 family)